MSLPNDIISLLRDEACLVLCRESLDEALEGVTAHKAEVAGTRPPFGILAMPTVRKTFEHSMRTALDNESQLESRLARIDTLEHWLKATLHTRLHYYLWEASPDYRYSSDVITAIDAWEREVDPYGDKLLAFARDLKNAARSLAGPKENSRTAFDLRAAAMTELRISTENLDRSALRLEAAAGRLTQAVAGTIYEKTRVFAPPFINMTQWVDKLAPLSDVDAASALQTTEAEVRTLLAKKLSPLHARAEAAREMVTEAGRHYLESYWEQLRQHALAYYVKGSEVDEVLDELTARHVAATRERGQQILQGKADPYMHER